MSPSGTIYEPLQHTFSSPPFGRAEVADAMRLGVVSCPAATPLREAARIMATNRIHCVVVFDVAGEQPVRVVSDLDLTAAAGEDLDKRTVGEVARAEPLKIGSGEPLARAAQLMVEHETPHLLVVQPESGHPVGVLSTLDLAGVLAWGN